MTLIFDAIFNPKKLENKRRLDGMVAVVIIYVLFIVSLHDVLGIRARDWKLIILGLLGSLFYVYGSAGINTIIFRFRDHFGYVSSFPAVFVPYIFVPPLYLFFSSFWIVLFPFVWSAYLEYRVARSFAGMKTAILVLVSKGVRSLLISMMVMVR